MLDAIIIAGLRSWRERGGGRRWVSFSFLRGMEFLFSKKAIDFICQLLCPIRWNFIFKFTRSCWEIFVYICDVCDIFVVSVEF